MVYDKVMTKLKIIQGDITKLSVDAIVNAANEGLMGGGGVDGAIHAAAGPELLAECQAIGGCPTGEARITKGYRLPAKFVIHTVGPVWDDDKSGEPELLRKCYQNSLRLAHGNGIKTIAFPSISTGAFRFPIEKAAPIAIEEINSYIHNHPNDFDEITIVTHSEKDFNAYQNVLTSN